ncbi:type I polyketide synthase [Carnimonas nigrificans]|uniref:type I polyketide synthase n=1 Tax=Carnimonas nigrificans TaxID=64323 RepID=UPI0004703D85|nr:type I polyketide synthase [Carnimonas nigrificans]
MTKKVAIIGAAYRFPGADTIKAFADALINERDLVTEVDSSRWDKYSFQHPDRKHPGTSVTFAAGSLGDISGFDAEFFGISPREAAQLDPQQRIMLELAWQTMEHAGIKPSSLRGSDCGVYLGVASLDYSYRLAEDLALTDTTTATSNTMSLVSNRISYLFDLHGPSVSMDTACSSAMVAFHHACAAIRAGDIDMALTGGISLHLHPFGFLIFSKASMLSANGRCRSFDADGDGYVRSEGAGMFMLKDYDKAVADGDRIIAVVAGSGVNTDGSKQGLTVPNPAAQQSLMARTLATSGISADELSYVEAHGTGTRVGDPIEVSAIGDAFASQRQAPLPIGSVKSNIGHMETASGVAGLAKALHVLTQREIPATIGVRRLNPALKVEERNIEVVTQRRSLPASGKLVVAVNSFGFGGANAHVLLESAPDIRNVEQNLPQSNEKPLPLFLSAKSPDTLTAQAGALAHHWQHLAQHSDAAPALERIASELWFRREHLNHGMLLWPSSDQQAIQQLEAFANSGSNAFQRTLSADAARQGPVFVYSGNGCQWFGMGQALLKHSPLFAQTIDQVDALYQPLAGTSLRAELEGQHGDRLDATEFAQPTLFAIQVGLTQLLREHGIEPAAVVGHSVGEVAAAWACGALSLAQAVSVIHWRSHYQGKTRGAGAMLAAALEREELDGWLADPRFSDIVIAGTNSAKGFTLAGDTRQIAQLQQALTDQRIFARTLPLDYAFHSPAMDSVKQALLDSLSDIRGGTTRCPMYSTVTGKVIEGSALDADYWWHNIRQPVAFHAALNGLIGAGFRLFTEVGTHPILQRYIKDSLAELGQSGAILTTLKRPTHDSHDSEISSIEQCIAALWISGIEIPIERWLTPDSARIDLPHYVWQRESHWYSNSGDQTGLVDRRYEHPLLGYPLVGHDHRWQSELDTQRLSWLADHNVGDSVIFPGAGFAELMLAAAASWQGRSVIEVEALEILSPLLLDAAPSKEVRTEIDERQGHVSIHAREAASGDAWHLHGRARLPADTLGLSLAANAPSLPSRQPDFERQQHLAQAQQLGLNYGPAFQGIAHGWLEEGCAIAVLENTAAISESQSECLLPPGLLDSAFQLFIPLLSALGVSDASMAFVPVRLERLQFNAEASAPALACVRPTQRSPHSLCADLELFDASGKAVAVIEGARFRAVRLKSAAQRPIERLRQRLAPAPLSNAIVSRETLQPPIVTDSDFARLGELTAHSSQRYSEELEPLLEAMTYAFAEEARQQHHGSADDEALKRLFERLALSDDDATAEATDTSAADIWQLALQDYPDYAELVLALGRAGYCLGSAQPPEMDTARLWQAAMDNATRKSLATDISQLIERHVAELPAGQRLTLIEVAARQLSWLPRLSPGNGSLALREQLITLDDSAWHDAHLFAPSRAGLDIYKADEPIEAGSDAALVLVGAGITSPQLKQLLEQLTQQRRTLQLLFVGPRSSRWQALVEQGKQPLPCTSEQVRQLLELYDFAVESGDSDAAGIELLLATAPEINAQENLPAPPQHWLICSDASSQAMATALAEALQEADQQVTQNDGTTPPAALLLEVDHIVDLALLGCSAPDARCTRMATWWQQLEQHASAARLWWFTLGATQQWSNAQHITLAEDAASWGFGRTLQNESGGDRVRLVDLPAQVDHANECPDALIDALLAQLIEPDAELEVVFDEDGTRLAPRVEVVADESATTPDTALTLGFDVPGQLRHLRWKERTLAPLGDDDVEISVKATGLNFRDVMYALGLLSDEAVEQGFAGASLGLKFSGEVVRTGANVTRFAPGDAVVGFGPSSFSTRLIARQHTLAPIPAGISYAAAATLPTTFFTVYYSLKHQARLEAGERLLIHGAAGGVGLAAIQIGRWLGAEIYATAGSDEKRDVLRLMGVEHIYDSRSTTFAEALLADTPDHQGVDVVLNSLAGEAIAQNLRVLRPFGRFVELGKRDFYDNTQVGLRPFRNNLSYFGVDSDQLMQERPALTERLFGEMMALFGDGTLSPLPFTAFSADRVVEAYRYMQQARQIGKVVVTYEQPPKAQSSRHSEAPLTLDPTGSYLITGGLSGFGLATARWLADHGARHLVLVSRRGLNAQTSQDEEAQQAIEQLKAQGVTVNVAACDVSQREPLTALLGRLRQEEVPLTGVVHAATVIDDALVRDLTPEQITNSMRAKVEGARLLDELTRSDDLSLFVLYSSATTLFGNPGQSSYIAANMWLEALAASRRSQGLAATCISWGAINDVGFLARNTRTRDTLVQRLGGRAMNASEALEALGQALVRDSSNEGLLPFDWATTARFLPTSSSPRYRLLPHDANEQSDSDGDEDLRQQLMSLSPEQQREALIALLRRELATILLSDEASLETERSVYDMGFDSLMGVELVTALEGKLGIQVPVMVLNDSATIAKLADYLVERLTEGEEGGTDNEDEVLADIDYRHGISEG